MICVCVVCGLWGCAGDLTVCGVLGNLFGVSTTGSASVGLLVAGDSLCLCGGLLVVGCCVGGSGLWNWLGPRFGGSGGLC